MIPVKAPPTSMTPQQAFDYSAQMVDLWDEAATLAEEDLWEAQVDAIRAAYQADQWAEEEQTRYNEIEAAKNAQIHAHE